MALWSLLQEGLFNIWLSLAAVAVVVLLKAAAVVLAVFYLELQQRQSLLIQ
jgi:hypothetical protein